MGALGTGIFFPGSLSAASFLSGRSGNPKEVLVIGAGLAGLPAAWELKNAGHKLTVLEARNRLGGVFLLYGSLFPKVSLWRTEQRLLAPYTHCADILSETTDPY